MPVALPSSYVALPSNPNPGRASAQGGEISAGSARLWYSEHLVRVRARVRVRVGVRVRGRVRARVRARARARARVSAVGWCCGLVLKLGIGLGLGLVSVSVVVGACRSLRGDNQATAGVALGVVPK